MTHDQLATQSTVTATIAALKSKNYQAEVVPTGAAALERIKQLIPGGVSVMNGSSTTLEQVGFIEYLKSRNHPWNNLHETILEETDPEKQALLRKQSVVSDYYLGSMHALVENGEFVIASNTGSQLPHVVFTSQNLIFVVSTKKIVSTLGEAMNRLEQHVVPLEDNRMKQAYGIGTTLNKVLIFKGENPMRGRKIHILLVEEDLGF